MTRDEVTQVLAVIQSYDQRTVGESDVLAWHGALGDLRFEECRDAALAHYRDSTDRIMPAHVRKRVTAARQDKAMRQLPTSPGELIQKPEWFESIRDQALQAIRAANEQRRERGLAPFFGETIRHPRDGMPR